MPLGFCFLYKGHPLDPTVEAGVKAATVAMPHEQHLIVFIDNVQCGNIVAAKQGAPSHLAK